MINIPPIKQSTAVKIETISELTKTWKVGQILNGTTQRGGEALSNVIIRIGQQSIEAKTPITLQDGQNVKLLVKSLAEGSSVQQITKLPLLSILETQPVVAENKLAAIKLRQFIAIQQSFSQVQQLAQNTLNHKLNTDLLPNQLKKLLINFQHTLQLSTKNISSEQLKQQIQNSGIFLEAKLANKSSTNTLFSDFKFQLLAIKTELAQLLPTQIQPRSLPLNNQQIDQLQNITKLLGHKPQNSSITALTDKLVSLLPKAVLTQLHNALSGQKAEPPLPNELQKLVKLFIHSPQQSTNQHLQDQLQFRLMLLELSQQIEQSISKVTSLQLQPMSREGDNLVLLLFNMVFKDHHEFFDIDFRIQQEDEKEDKTEESWSVVLSFNFKTLGKVQSKIHLVGDTVSNAFHTEYITTADKIKPLLPLLEVALIKTGLKISNLSVENNLLENKPFVSKQVSLLDENA